MIFLLKKVGIYNLLEEIVVVKKLGNLKQVNNSSLDLVPSKVNMLSLHSVFLQNTL